MPIWNWFFGGDTTAATFQADTAPMVACNINPATGLPMLDSCGGLDVGGNPYGVDWSQQTNDNHTAPDFFADCFVDFGTD